MSRDVGQAIQHRRGLISYAYMVANYVHGHPDRIVLPVDPYNKVAAFRQTFIEKMS